MQPDDQNPARDRELGMDRRITRRDFLNGLAVTIGATLVPASAQAEVDAVPPAPRGLGAKLVAPPPPDGRGPDPSSEDPLLAEGITQNDPRYYPPVLTGMRGSHPGSFETAHLLRNADFWQAAGEARDTGESYDLVVAGGGISGLSAAHFFRSRAGKSARILIIDNHDDFGGHAKRNEFHIRGRKLLMNGGTLGIDSPTPYSRVANALLEELGIDPPVLQAHCADSSLYRTLGLKPAIFFDKETFGADRLVASNIVGGYRRSASPSPKAWAEFLAQTPLAPEVQRDIVRIETAKIDYMPGLSSAKKKDRLWRMSYNDYLLKIAKVHPGVIPFYQRRTNDEWGVGTDAEPALDCWAWGLSGFQGLGLAPGTTPHMSYTAAGYYRTGGSYRFHFPDGNASIARALVRSLIPESAPGHTAEDLVTAKFDYTQLDRAGAPVRIRLNSTVVRVRHVGKPATAREVEVTYAYQKKPYTVRAKAVVLACWNTVIPFICPDLPSRQKEALLYLVKVPLVYTSVAIRNWSAFHKLGIARVFAPGAFWMSVSLNEAVNIGDYKSPRTPEDPMLLFLTRTPCRPGLAARQQQIAGRMELFTTPFETFELNIRDQLGRMLGAGGFDPARDIEAITVNRWPHGYGYEYNPLFDPDWPEAERPNVIGRKRFGRITIANTDSGATAYTDVAINQAHRAVSEFFAAYGSGR